MNLAFISLILFLIVQNFQSKNQTQNYLIALLFGFSLLIHIKNILIAPAVLFAFYHTNDNKKILNTILQFCPMLIFSSILIIIPLLTNSNTFASVLYENANTMSKFIDHTLSFYLVSTIKHIGYLIYNFHILIFGIFYSMYLVYKSKPILFWFLIGFGLPYFLFSLLLDVPDSFVFALIFYLVCAIFLGFVILLNTK